MNLIDIQIGLSVLYKDTLIREGKKLAPYFKIPFNPKTKSLWLALEKFISFRYGIGSFPEYATSG
jgi:hypothetical protein